MDANLKRKGSVSRDQDNTTKRGRWETRLAVPPSESSPMASGSALISGVHTAQIYGGTFTVAAPGSTHYHTTVHNYNYGPQPVPFNVLEILNLLSLPNSRDIQLDTLSKATDGTCVWLTKGDMFLFWIAKGKILWGIGIPGAGKTVLASLVIRDLEEREEASGGRICVAYVYLRYSQPLTIRDILESLVKQLIERHFDLSPIVEGLYLKHQQEGTRPSQQQLVGVLTEFIKQGKALVFVLDALDEMRAADRPVFVGLLVSLDAKLFITSRPLDTLQTQFPQAQIFNIAAGRSDIDLHIKDFLRHCPDLMVLLNGTDLEEHIVDTVHQKSGGMFLHVKLQLEALSHCISALDVEETLDAFPTDIDAIYMKTWELILVQAPKHSNLAKLILLWITHAYSEMTVETLRRAIATSPDTYAFEPKRMVPEALMLSVCCGLVSVEEKTKIVRLMHYTTRDVILPRILELYPIPHAIPAQVCIAHLIQCGFQNYSHKTDILERVFDLRIRLRDDTLLAYAHRSWVHHTHQDRRNIPVMEALNQLLLNCTNYPLEDWSHSVDYGGPLHVAAFYGLEDLVPSLAARLPSPNTLTVDKQSPLTIAARRGDLACIKALLLLPDINVNLSDMDGSNALMHAILEGHVECVQLLLEAPGLDINAVDVDGSTALIIAAEEGHTTIVQLLLGFPGINFNATNEDGRTALLLAARKVHIDVVVQLLNASGIDVNVAASLDGETALSHASKHGHKDMVNLLMAFPGIIVSTSVDSL